MAELDETILIGPAVFVVCKIILLVLVDCSWIREVVLMGSFLSLCLDVLRDSIVSPGYFNHVLYLPLQVQLEEADIRGKES